MTNVLVISTPYQYSFGPALAPALLRSCLEVRNISATAWDLVAEFNHSYSAHPNYDPVVAWMQSPELQLTIDEFNWYTNIVVGYAERIVNQYKPKHLAISVMTISGQRFTEDLCYYIKKNSDISIVVGGSGADVVAHQFGKPWYQVLLDSGIIDTVIVGEGEFSLPHVISNGITGVYREQQLTNDQLDQIPVPNYDDYNLTIYSKEAVSYISYFHTDNDQNLLPWTITATKGCVRKCTFCDVGRIWPKFRFRSGTRVAEEIIALHQQYGANYFSFTDSLINGGLKPMFEMNQVLADTIPHTIKYEAQAIFRGAHDMPEKYFEIMSRAGCYHVNIGLESGSEQVREHMGKCVKDEDIEYSAGMFLKYNILQTWNIVVGYPTETDDDFQKTIELVKHWFNQAQGKIQFIPVDTFLMLEGVPMTTTDLYTQLDIHQEIIHGYRDFAWVSGLNPSNTYEVRAKRFIEICELLRTLNGSKEHITKHLDRRITKTQRKLAWYHEHSTNKKVFRITQV